MRERGDERVGPVVHRDGESTEARSGDAVRADDQQRLLAERPHQTNRLRDGQHVGEPLQRVLRAVGELGPTDEPLEQAEARGEDVVLLGYRSLDRPLDRDAHARDAGVRRPVALKRGSAGARADDQRGGRGQQP